MVVVVGDESWQGTGTRTGSIFLRSRAGWLVAWLFFRDPMTRRSRDTPERKTKKKRIRIIDPSSTTLFSSAEERDTLLPLDRTHGLFMQQNQNEQTTAERRPSLFQGEDCFEKQKAVCQRLREPTKDSARTRTRTNDLSHGTDSKWQLNSRLLETFKALWNRCYHHVFFFFFFCDRQVQQSAVGSIAFDCLETNHG